MYNYSGSAPVGQFSYKNQLDNTICNFSFNSTGVTLIDNNGHCSVINEEPISNGFYKYQWNSIITIN